MKAGIYYKRSHLSDIKPFLDKIKESLIKNAVDCTEITSPNKLDGLDVLFILGGDGTILTAAAGCAKRGIKILGINCGHLGFLTEYEPNKADEAVQLVCGGNFAIQKRAMLEIECGGSIFYALNDLVIQRSTSGNGFSNTVGLRAKIDGSVVDNYLSDGIIISTPTGSTAYSLSAGGSILTPEINAFIMTPLCAHSLHSRPVVYSDSSILEIIPLRSKTPLNLIVDGKVVGTIDNSAVTVRKSAYAVEFITRGDKDFFEKLLIKLNIWSK